MVAAVTKSYDFGYGTNEPIFGNVTTDSDYDWGTGAKGPLLRQTTTTYQFQSNSNYLTGNLLDLPASVVVSNAAGYKCSETDYTYDNSSYLTAANITTQHGAPPGPVRGNLSSTARQLSATPCQQGAAWSPITSYTNMYDTGELYKSIDPLNHATTYTYSPTFVGAYPTTVTNALNQATQYNYDFSTGLLTSETDANLQPTTGQYDIVFRPILISYPDGGSTSYCYTDIGGSTCSKSGAPYKVVTTKAITSSPVLNETSTLVFDGLGRTSQTQLNSDTDTGWR
jgi:YD repeat-containing protein